MKVMIVGGGKLGTRLAATMLHENMDVTLVDSNPMVIEKINEHMDVLTVVANGINVAVLKELHIERFDLLVACTDNDATNSIICTFSKKLGCTQTIARIRDPEYMEQLDFIRDEMGIDLIINPDLATANTITKYLTKNVVFYAGEFGGGRVKMFDFSIGNSRDFVGKTVAQIDGLDDLLITAISRDGNLIIPDGATVLAPDDVIYVLGMWKNIDALTKQFKLRRMDKKVENTLILGGGHIGYYLAKELAALKINVTLIEQDPRKVQKLAELLDHVLVIEGDGTDLSLLEEESIEKMDAFIGVTGFDEQNLLMALLAKQSGVSKTIAKVSRPNYVHVIDKLDIDVAINPINITASNILKFVRGGKVASVSLLLGGKGEVTEIIVSPDMPYVGKPIYKLHLPKGILIGTIIRGKEIIIPNGNSIIEANDRLVVFTLAEDIDSLKQLFRRSKGGFLGEFWNRS